MSTRYANRRAKTCANCSHHASIHATAPSALIKCRVPGCPCVEFARPKPFEKCRRLTPQQATDNALIIADLEADQRVLRDSVLKLTAERDDARQKLAAAVEECAALEKPNA